MSTVKINFDAPKQLHKNFKKAIKIQGYSHLSEVFREYMRQTVNTVLNVHEVKELSNPKPNDTKSYQ